MALTPLTCDLLGWRQSSLTSAMDGSSDIGAYFFFGGLLMSVASVMEVIWPNAIISRSKVLTLIVDSWQHLHLRSFWDVWYAAPVGSV